ncbi:MAG TPA: hypothetical protein PK286_01075, partial [Devosia sp.]|nr:hypothetical protein [Devosia sp.]
PIDKAAQVVDRPIIAKAPVIAVEPKLEIDPELGMPVPPSDADVPRAAVDEGAAMRDIEGGHWQPRRGASHRPVQLPEQSGDAEASISNARSAVASATAAAAAAIAGSEASARDQDAVTPLDFDAAPEAERQSFLDTPEPVDPSGLQFETTHVAFGRPAGLPAPRGGEPDNLKQIKGVTAQLESSLHQLGIYHFDQIASWDQKAVRWIDTHLALKGRLAKEKWVEQARDLSLGKTQAARPVRR